MLERVEERTVRNQLPLIKFMLSMASQLQQLIVMCGPLRDIYDKKSPIFLTEIGVLVATIIVWQYPVTCEESLRAFYLTIMSVSGLEIILKSVGLAIIHTINKQVANTAQTLLVALFIVCHLGLWVYSLVLLRTHAFVQECAFQEPHYFYVKMYFFMYSIIIIGSFILFLLLLIPVTALTLFSFKKKEELAED